MVVKNNVLKEKLKNIMKIKQFTLYPIIKRFCSKKYCEKLSSFYLQSVNIIIDKLNLDFFSKNKINSKCLTNLIIKFQKFFNTLSKKNN
jgi:hypothetical protein